jgi:electron transport complex protein RnfB
MTDDVYQRLAEHLDPLPQRFPSNTGTGLELKVLRHIFSPEEAEMAIQLQPMPELPATSVKLAARWTASRRRIIPRLIWDME